MSEQQPEALALREISDRIEREIGWAKAGVSGGCYLMDRENVDGMRAGLVRYITDRWPHEAEAAAEPSRAESPAPIPAEPGAAIVESAEGTSAQAHRPGPKRMIGREAVQHCYGCGARWPCEGSWQLRAETAEAKLAEVRGICRDIAEQQPSVPAPVAAILEIIGGERSDHA